MPTTAVAKEADEEAWQFQLGVFALPLPPSAAHRLPTERVLRIYTEEQAAAREEEQEAARGLATAAEVARAGAEAWLGQWSGNFVSTASEVLARVLLQQPQPFWAGKRVVELGAGCGLSGLAAASTGAQEVVLTDQVLFMLRWNTLVNFGSADLSVPAPDDTASDDEDALAALGGSASVPLLQGCPITLRTLRWGDEADIAAARTLPSGGDAPFDVLIGSDIMYHQPLHEPLADTIAALTGPGSTVFWSTADGDLDAAHGQGFYERLRRHGFRVRDVTEQPKVAAAKADSGYSTGSWPRIHDGVPLQPLGLAAVASVLSRGVLAGVIGTSVHVMLMERGKTTEEPRL